MRPTKERIKQALFNILQFEIAGKTFLDLFGGTGQVGIEAASRGADKVWIVDNNPEAIKIIRQNTLKCKHNHPIEIIKQGAEMFLENFNGKIDIAFLDPPYAETELLEICMKKLAQKAHDNAILITETLSTTAPKTNFKDFTLQKTYKYGKIALNVYKTDKFI